MRAAKCSSQERDPRGRRLRGERVPYQIASLEAAFETQPTAHLSGQIDRATAMTHIAEARVIGNHAEMGGSAPPACVFRTLLSLRKTRSRLRDMPNIADKIGKHAAAQPLSALPFLLLVSRLLGPNSALLSSSAARCRVLSRPFPSWSDLNRERSNRVSVRFDCRSSATVRSSRGCSCVRRCAHGSFRIVFSSPTA